jgi:putative phage-type endonuclease
MSEMILNEVESDSVGINESKCIFDKILNISNELPPQCSELWLKFRYNKLTGSDLATAIGTNPYSNSRTLLIQKVTGITNFKGNEATEWGKRYESDAIKMYELVTGETVKELNIIPHPTIDFLAYSPDGLTLPKNDKDFFKLIEIKCPMKRKIDDSIPDHYYAQVQLGLHTLYKYGIDTTCDFIEYCPYDNHLNKPFQLKILNIKRSQEWWDKHVNLIYTFWENVLKYRKLYEINLINEINVNETIEIINNEYEIVRTITDYKESKCSKEPIIKKSKIIDNKSVFLIVDTDFDNSIISKPSKPSKPSKAKSDNNISDLLQKLKLNNKKIDLLKNKPENVENVENVDFYFNDFVINF